MRWFRKGLIWLVVVFMLAGSDASGIIARAENNQDPKQEKNVLPSSGKTLSGKAAQNGEIHVDFDEEIKNGENVVKMKPKESIKAPPGLLEQAERRKEELLKPAVGLFDTTLDIIPENDTVKLEFSLHNISGNPLAFYFSSGQRFDIFVADDKGAEVYRWSHDKCFTMAIINMELKKNEKLSFSESWDFKDNKGNRVPPGKYVITVKWLAKIESGKAVDPDELTATKDMEMKPSPDSIVIADSVPYNLSADSKRISLWAYEIDDGAYFKLRDLAMALGDTEKCFEVSWIAEGEYKGINLSLGVPYTPVGGELSPPPTNKGNKGSAAARPAATAFYSAGGQVAIFAYIIDSVHYVRLSDLADALKFAAVCDKEKRTVQIDTSS